jgi:hypothetical protein
VAAIRFPVQCKVFVFDVIEHDVDSTYRFSGLGAFVKQILPREKRDGVESATHRSGCRGNFAWHVVLSQTNTAFAGT